MDELVYIRFNRVNSDDKWEATDRGRILIEGVWETSHMVSAKFYRLAFQFD